MSSSAILQLILLSAVIAGVTPLLGSYMAKVYGGGAAPGDRVFGPTERVIYRLVGVDPDREQHWTTYARSALAFSVMSVLALYLIQRVQGWLPLNPTGMEAVAPSIAFNTAASFVTNTNWQAYAGESTMSHLTQMLGMTVQNFASAAVGIAVAVALVRGLVRRRAATIGNFWVDLTRTFTRVLFPIAFIAALVFAAQGVVQNLSGGLEISTVAGGTQTIPGGPLASQEVIKLLGTNGGGFYNANSAHPFENPTAVVNLLQIVLVLMIPFSLTWTFGTMARSRKQGWVVFAAMFILWAASAALVVSFENGGNPRLTDQGVTQIASATQSGGNMEGKEVRFGATGSGLFSAAVTGTSTGAVNSAHDSYTPFGGAVPLVNMMLGEISPGGVGSGLYGMLVFALLAVFIAGLMVGRTPELLGKKIQPAEMKLVMLFLLAVPAVILIFSAISVVMGSAKASIFNPGPHGLSEIVYAYTSGANNNGSAFGGLNATTDWYTTTIGLAMLCGRFLLMIPVLAIAGSMAAKQPAPPSAGTFPTDTPLFTGLLIGVILIVVGLTFFPALALGPLVEGLGL